MKKNILEEAMATIITELEKVHTVRQDAYYKACNAAGRGDVTNYNKNTKKVLECNKRQIELTELLHQVETAYAAI